MTNPIVVFSKPWKTNLDGTASRFAELGVSGFELPIRPGYAVDPDNCVAELPRAVKIVAAHGQRIFSVAAEPTETVIAACAAAGVGLIRYCIPIDMAIGYAASIERFRSLYSGIEPALRQHGVRLGVQNHCFSYVGSAVALMQAIHDLDHADAVLDLTHCAIAGEPFDMALDIARRRMVMVNIKGVIHRDIAPAEATEADWELDWLTGREGLLPWRKAVAHLKSIGYAGPIGLSPDYGSTSRGRIMGDGAWAPFEDDARFLRELLASA
jgi:sugar phosphate isomerase/epimerase